jgi:hypothetical protein
MQSKTVSSRRVSSSEEVAMIKDVMVWLDGAISDEIRLAAVDEIARQLELQFSFLT